MENFRCRSKNFEKDENQDLMEAVKPYKAIVNCRQTSAISKTLRADTWVRITNQFNATSRRGHQRTPVELERHYKKLKGDCKKDMAFQKQYITQTGGGPPANDFGLTKTEVYGVSNPFDSNGNINRPQLIEIPEGYEVSRNIKK